MTRHLITTPYGADALARLREVVAEAKRADAMAPVTILVPNHLAGIVARRALARGLAEGPGIAGLRITTIPRLAEELAAVALAPRRPQTRPVTAAAWRVALDTDPGAFAPVAAHAATIEALTRAHRALRDLDSTALDVVARSGPVAADVVRIHRRVVEALTPDWYDETDLLYAAIGSAQRVRGAVVLHLPQVLTRAEQQLVAELDAVADLTVVLGLTGVQRADREVLACFGEPPERARDVRPPTATHVVSSSDSDDEVRCVGRAVLADLAEGVPADRIAVLYAAPNPYARLLLERFAAMGVTTNGPGVRAPAERSVARLLLELIDLADATPGEDLPRAELFRALSSVSVVDPDEKPIPLSRWERTSRDAGVVRGDDWDVRLERLVVDGERAIADERAQDDPRQARIDAIERRIAGAAGLRAFMIGLRARLSSAARLTTWADLTTWALDLLDSLVPEATMQRLPAEERAAAAAVVGALQRLRALDDLERTASVRTLRDVLRIELDGAPPRIGTVGLGVLVAPISAAIGLDLDRVHVVGVAEDLYPGRIAEDALLPDRARRASGQLPPLRRRLDDRHRELLAAMQAAPSTTVSFPRGDLRRSTRRLPSRWLLPTLRELGGDHALPMTEWDRDLGRYGDAVTVSGSFAGELLSTSHLADAQEWRTRAIAAGDAVEDAAIEAARTMLHARASDAFTAFDGDLRGTDGLPDLLTSDVAIAPTRLESYASCPHAYFVQRLLRVEPLQQPEELLTISALDIGSFLHDSLDELAKAGPLPMDGAPWSVEQRSTLQAIALRRADELQARGVTGHPRLWAVEREQLLNDLVQILDDDDRIREERGATVLASELAFGLPGADGPVEIAVPGGRVLMKGSADRVDRTATGTLVVIDMKTGGDSSYRPIAKAEDRLVRGTKLQLPVYALAARRRFGSDAVQAEYWFVRRDMRRIEVPLAEVEAQYAATVGLLARSMRDGVFPQRPPEQPDFLWVQCPYCNPDRIGHGDARERWERKRWDGRLAGYVGLVEPGVLGEDEQEGEG